MADLIGRVLAGCNSTTRDSGFNRSFNVIAPLSSSALQSPIEYQRRESKSNSLGRSMRPPLSAASALRPHSSASIDRHKLPSLHSHNTSLPALYLPSQGQGQVQGQGQGQGAGETSSQQDVSGLLFLLLFLFFFPGRPHKWETEKKNCAGYFLERSSV